MKKMLLLTILFAAFLVPQCVKAVDVEGFYVGATGAANFANSTKRHRGKYDTGFFGALDLGYRWCNGFHLEAEVAYRYNERKHHNRHHRHSESRRHHRHHGHRDVWAAMVNVLYDINMCWCVEPYVGVGIGYAHVRDDHDSRHFNRRRHHHHNRDNNAFAWQVIAGVAYPICDNVDLAIEYRFFDTTNSKRHSGNVYNNDIGVNVKYYF